MGTLQTKMESHVRQLRADLDLRPDQIDIAEVLPIFVPSSFFAHGNWVGPFSRLRAPGIGLTWSVPMPNQTMRYVDHEMKRHWEAQQLDWKTLAMNNLSRQTNENPGGVRERRSPANEPYSIAFMFEDGYGPSRLLLRESLALRFPAGYRVAMPEMSCGFAFAKDLPEEELAMVQGVIDHCYRNGTRRFVPGSYDPDDLLPVEEVG
jgi:hypothetical protein